MRHSVTQEIGQLDKIVWEFVLMEYQQVHTIFLENMFVMSRESTRHKFKVDFQKSYARINNRDCGVKEEPDVPIEVSTEAVHALRKSITFQKWPRR